MVGDVKSSLKAFIAQLHSAVTKFHTPSSDKLRKMLKDFGKYILKSVSELFKK